MRAYCTQPVSEMATISTPKASVSCASGNSARPTPSTSSAIRIDGKDSITSHSRMMKASSRPPTKPESSPSVTPTSADTTTEATPTNSEMRAPYISAERMSRPWSSVPSRYFVVPPSSQAGGRRESPSSSVARSKGSCGATQPAKTAQKAQTSATAAATMATGERRKLNHRSLSATRRHGEGDAAGRPAGAAPLTGCRP